MHSDMFHGEEEVWKERWRESLVAVRDALADRDRVQTRVDQVEAELAAAHSRAAALSAQLDDRDAQIAALTAHAEGLSEEVAGLGRQVADQNAMLQATEIRRKREEAAADFRLLQMATQLRDATTLGGMAVGARHPMAPAAPAPASPDAGRTIELRDDSLPVAPVAPSRAPAGASGVAATVVGPLPTPPRRPGEGLSMVSRADRTLSLTP